MSETDSNIDDSEHNSLRAAGLGKRLAAMFYDSMLLIGILFLATAVLGFASGSWQLDNAPLEGEVVHELPPVVSGLGYQLYLVALIYLFNCYFWWKNGQTLGMQSWRLRVIDEQGETPDWGRCSLRWLVSVVSLLAGGLGYWWALWQRDGRSWHDLASKTRVVVLPKN